MEDLGLKFDRLEKKLSRLEDILLMGQKEMLVVDDVARLTGIGKNTIYQLTCKKLIPHYKPSRKLLYFKKSEIVEWMQQNRVSTDAELEAEAAAYNLKRSLKNR